MQADRRLARFIVAAIFVLCSAAAHSQNDVAASLYGAFNQSTSGNAVQQSPSNAAGVLLELRHIRTPLVGYELTYAYNRANQSYTGTQPGTCGLACGTHVQTSVPNNAHEITGDWVVSLPMGGLRPFVLAGGGLLLNVPSKASVPASQCAIENNVCSMNSVSTHSAAKGVLVYGAGVDWTLSPYLGLRFQYRGNVYKAAALTNALSSTNAFMQTAEPVIGVFLQF